mgnify:CR=1 FL=1
MVAREAHDVIELIGRLRAAGVTLMLIEHNMSFLMPLADRIACLDQGRMIATGTAREVRSDPAVIRAYLGEAASA